MRRAPLLLAAWLSAAPARALVPDAAAWARGGIDALDRLERSPGARLPPGCRLAVDSWQIDPLAGIDALALRVAASTARQAIGVTIERLRSPVHEDRGIALGAQLHSQSLAGGLAVEAHRLEFITADHTTATRALGGFGFQSGRCGFVAALDAALNPRRAPRLRMAAAWAVVPAVQIQTQVDREPAAPAAWRIAAAWRADPVTWFAGYDSAIDAATAGLDCALGRLHITWGARAHPDLGVSHVWTCEWRF